jgi:hypothetical protein
VSDTTAQDGSIDAVAESLIATPVKEDEEDQQDLQQPDEGDAPEQAEADDVDEGEEPEVDEADEAEDESEADAEDEAPAEQLFTVKVDGREQQVPLSELLRGYSGQAYIQKGMQEVAATKQEAESVYIALQSERQQLAQMVQAVQSGQVSLQPPQKPDESLLQTDPIGYLEARVKYDNDVAAYQQTQQQLQYVTQQQSEAQQRAYMAHLAQEQQKLTQVIPAFANPETAAKVKQDLIATGTEVYGYTADELRQVADHRALRVLHDAAQYRRLMSGKKAVEAPTAAPKTPTIRPGTKPSAQANTRVKAEKAKAQMKRTGSVDDVAKFLLM